MAKGWAYHGQNNGWVGSAYRSNAISKPLGVISPNIRECDVYWREFHSGT